MGQLLDLPAYNLSRLLAYLHQHCLATVSVHTGICLAVLFSTSSTGINSAENAGDRSDYYLPKTSGGTAMGNQQAFS